MRSSLNRRGLSLRCQITLGAQAPPMIIMHAVSEKLGSRNPDASEEFRYAPLLQAGSLLSLVPHCSDRARPAHEGIKVDTEPAERKPGPTIARSIRKAMCRPWIWATGMC